MELTANIFLSVYFDCNNGGISIQTFRWVSNFYCNACKLNIKLIYFIFIQSRNLTQLGDKNKLTENWPDREKQIARQFGSRFWVTDEKISIGNSLYSVIHLGMFQPRNVPECWKHTIFPYQGNARNTVFMILVQVLTRKQTII